MRSKRENSRIKREEGGRGDLRKKISTVRRMTGGGGEEIL